MDPATYRPAPSSIPTDPGVYRFTDPDGRVIYVGKAKNLRSRLNSYFADPASLLERTRRMVFTAARVDWTVVSTEVEALQLEYTWIKQYEPRFNIKYRDDKTYPWLAVTWADEFPRVHVGRGAKKKGNRYFGPYGHAWAIRETVDLLLRVFPMRSCSTGVFNSAQRSGRPCLLGYLDKCSAPCVGRISAADHRQIADEFCQFMAGRSQGMVRRLEQEMARASENLEFERAASLRDDLAALAKVNEHNAVVLPDGTDADVIALVDDELEVSVQIFHVRQGRIRGRRGWIADRAIDATVPDLVEAFLQQLYAEVEVGEINGASQPVPREVLVPELPSDVDAVRAWLDQRRGSRVDLRVPRRGDKKALMETVRTNAAEALARHKTRRAGDLTTRSRALEEIAAALMLPEAPLRIECFDVSHTQNTERVASMVVFEDGLPRKNAYRRFVIRDGGNDDTAAMHEVLTRRFARTTDDEKSTGFAYPPQLLVVDGGAPQVAAAQRALDELAVTIPLCGLAKRLEEIWLPDQEFPVILPRHSEGLYLMQRIRDEAHRFAISHHRQRRSKSQTRSHLDGIPGLGPARQKALLKHFGSVRKIRAADVDALMAVDGIGPALARAVHDHLTAQPTPMAINTATGEVTET